MALLVAPPSSTVRDIEVRLREERGMDSAGRSCAEQERDSNEKSSSMERLRSLLLMMTMLVVC